VIRFVLLAWDRLSLYLPVALMGLLALGTYWLVQSSPKAGVPAVEGAVRHDPDYFMRNFSVRTFMETGRLKSEVFGSAARHFPDSDTTEIDKVRIRAFDDQDQLTTATAKRALTNSDASEVELFGNALIVREAIVAKGVETSPRLEFRGEYLHAFMDTERVVSDKPVELQRGRDVFSADTMEYDNQHEIMVMRGRVKGLLVPVTAK
jgi:lipopolysaccharide export system protein LptC